MPRLDAGGGSAATARRTAGPSRLRLGAGSIAVLLLGACTASGVEVNPVPPSAVAAAPSKGGAGERATVQSVFDGDTILVNEATVRLIGLNAPERDQPFYEEARNHLRELVSSTEVTLVSDVQEKDQFGRRLAYVYLPDDRLANLEMVRAGYGQAYTLPPNLAHVDAFRQAEREALDAGRGLWERSDVTLRIAAVVADAPGPDERNLNGESVLILNTGTEAVGLVGLRLHDVSNNEYRFPERELASGGRVRVHSGYGTDSDAHLYWGRNRPVWNNDGDAVILRDRDGLLVDAHRYGR